MTIGLTLTVAVEADRADLAAFGCGSGNAYFEEVNGYVCSRAFDYATRDAAPDDDHRLMVLRSEAGDLVAVAAHEFNWRVEREGCALDGSEIVVLAISEAYQGQRGASGSSLFRHVVDLVLQDVAARGRGPWVTMLVHPENEKMLGICRAVPLHIENPMASGESCFVMRL